MYRSFFPVSAQRALLGAVVTTFLLLAGCTAANETTVRTSGTAPAVTPSEAEKRVRSAFQRWKGAPYEYGGSSPQGVDCSALVQSVFREEFGLTLPRSTKKQARVGKQISRSALQPGDLVFFNTGWKQDHVGIYLSDGEFLHVSSNVGVTISPLDRSYWQDNWWQARRLLSSSGDRQNAAADTVRRPPASDVGW